MSSTGQAIGMVVGAVVGFFIPGGYVMLGAAIGGMIGSAIDPPKGPDIVGPRLDDLSIQTSTYGAPIARAYGTVSVVGNLFWLEGDQLRETTVEEEQGGKGGGGQSVTTYKYSATFAVGLLHVPDGATVSLRRLWVETDLIYESGSDNTESALASAEQVVGMMLDSAFSKGDSAITGSGGAGFSFYPGSDDQLPNARMQADKGVANVSAYPGLCYIVLNDLDLEKYSNTLMRAQVKCELVISGDITPQYDLIGTTSNTTLNRVATAVIGPSATEYFVIRHDGFDNVVSAAIYEYRYGESDRVLTEIDISEASGYGYTAPQMATCQQCAPGEIVAFASISLYLSGPLRQSLVRITSAGYEVGPQYLDSDGIWDYGAVYIFASDGGVSFAASHTSSAPVIKFNGVDLAGNSSVNVQAYGIGCSDNFVYVVNYTSTVISCVIEKFTRDLVFVETLTLPVSGFEGILQVIRDDVFYIKAGATISFYDGVSAYVVETTAPTSTNAEYSWFAWGGISPSSGITMTRATPIPYDLNLFHSVVEATPAKLRDIVTAECALAGVAAADLDLDDLTNSDVRGYKISARSSVRAALEPLQATFPFDVAASGYKVHFVSRGGASVATIPSDDLGATDSDEFPVLLPISREMESQLPYRVNVRYTDAGRDYDIGEQYAERPAESLGERTLELAIVMTADEAARTADVLLEKEWVERIDLGPFVLPPTWSELEAADVVTIQHRGQQHEARLTRVEYLPDGRIQCAAKKTQAASYVSTAQGSDPLTIGQSLVPLKGTTTGLLLDIPRLMSAQDVYGVPAAVYGLASGWPGGMILRSDDSGGSYNVVFSSNTAGGVFRATDAMPAGRFDIVDTTTVLTVSEVSKNPSLSSVSFASAASGQNLAAIGADGRWEIVSFMTVADNGNDTWTIRDFMRGRFGTEWAASLHESGDLMVVLTASAVGFIEMPSSMLNAALPYRAVTQGAGIDSAADQVFTYTGENLRPLAPCYMNGSRHPSTSDWTIEAIPRSRTPVEPFSGIATPDSEPPAAFEVDIFDDSGYTTKLRTLSGLSSPSATYTLAQQTTDFGNGQENIFVDFYKVSPIVGRGHKLRGSLTSILETDPYAAQVFCLLHFDGSGATITDVISGNTWTAYGNATQTTSDKKFGAAALTVDGSGDYVGMTFGAGPIGTGDFTFEWWEKPADAGNRGRLMLRNSAIGGSGNTNGIAAAWNGSAWNCYGAGGSQVLGGSANSTSAYTHMALERYGGRCRLYVGGSPLPATYSDPSDYTTHIYFYLAVYYSTAVPFYGIIDEFRGTAAARYRGISFTPPATPFPDP